MAAPDASPAARIASLEDQVRALTARVATLETLLRNSPRVEHPFDRDTVREKVSYDWQQ